jgi:hypothetical protein
MGAAARARFSEMSSYNLRARVENADDGWNVHFDVVRMRRKRNRMVCFLLDADVLPVRRTMTTKGHP